MRVHHRLPLVVLVALAVLVSVNGSVDVAIGTYTSVYGVVRLVM